MRENEKSIKEDQEKKYRAIIDRKLAVQDLSNSEELEKKIEREIEGRASY